jgi:DNA-binding MarR family transcriptional regulator
VNVQNSNNKKRANHDSYKSLLLLDEISKGNPLSQRDLSKKLNLALGLVNSYIKNLISKGYITIRDIPAKRYTYYLTSKGISEKSRLTYEHLQNFTNLYKVARKDFRLLFSKLEKDGIKKVAFCGVDEITEIAYISLQETRLELAGIFNNVSEGNKFFGYNVFPLEDIINAEFEIIIITSFQSSDSFKNFLVEKGIKEEKILNISSGGWLKKIGTH